MRGIGLFGRVRARLHHDERGFGLIETVIAVTIIFGSLLALAYTATAGFTYQDIARQRQTANGLANQVMEEVRGLAYDRITTGMLDTDLAGDSTYIKNCGGTPTVYRFQTCTTPPNATTGAGEKIVYSAAPAAVNPTTPLVPHHGTTTINNIAYDWYTYVTINDTAASAPYRVTVRVTWSGGATLANKSYQVQSFFYSPLGCRSTSTHPFAAPCQPFLFGAATVPNGNINVTGSIENLQFTSGDLLLTGATSSIEQEQLQQIQGTFHAPEASLTAGGIATSAGGVTGTSLADSDPNSTAVTTYSRQRCPTELTCTGGSTLSDSGNGTSITFTVPSNATAETDSAVSATGTNVCPPPSDTAETDTQPCAGSRITQVGTASAAATLPAIGSFTLAQELAPSAPTKAIVNRQLFPSSSGCTPTSTADGCVAVTATRTLGTLNIAGLPSGFTAPAGWSGASAWNGYFVSVVGYTDTGTASAGTNSPLATATFTSGSLYYWNGTGYTGPVSLTNAGLTGLSSSYSLTQSISGKDTTVTIWTDPVLMTTGATSAVTTPGTAGTATRTDATAQVTPPVVAVHYLITQDSETLVNLTITMRLGVLEARGTYAPAPATGS